MFDTDTLSHLEGAQFSRLFKFPLASASNVLDRFEFIESKFKDKNVVHVGCVDHKPLIKRKIEADLWMHARIDRIAKRCLGVDIDDDGVGYVKTELGYENLVCANVAESSVPEIQQEHWDYFFLGEILEHVDDPVAFLTAIRERYCCCVESIVITVPNALRRENAAYSRRGFECVNSDHRYWFTPYTLAKVATRAGMRPEEVHLVMTFPMRGRGPRSRLRRRQLKKYPALRDTVVLEARMQ